MNSPRKGQPAMPKINKQIAKGGATTLVLALLAERPMHGYELVQTIRERSDGLLTFGEGTVYPILYALRDKGFLQSESQESESGRPRKVYRVTDEGLKALAVYRADWQRLSDGMRLVMDG